MCGIAGFVGFDNDDLLRSMCRSLAHRGPDDEGMYTAPKVGLAHRRLSVIDLRGGRQPMPNEDKTIWIVFNGEVYNYQDLTADLRGRGHRFATTSDTETIVHAYEEYGLEFLSRLRGMFAFALWDDKRRRLVLARDRIGEKPLYYRQDGASVLFGSEAKAILQRDDARQVDPQAVCEYLAMGYVAAPRTFYADIRKLAPGHMLVHESGRATVRPYWQRGRRGGPVPSYAQAEEKLADLLSDTVRLCLKSDVEVGGFLSGGVDSSTIVALMRRHSAQVQSFAVGYEGEAKGYNELNYATVVADAVGTVHHELILEARSSVELLPKILWHYDEPHGEPTSVLVYLLCQFTRERVKVALGGTGGDEIFFGYPRFAGIRILQLYRRLPRLLRKQLVERVVLRWPETTKGGGFARRARRFVLGADLPPEQAYLSWVSLLHRDVRARLISEHLAATAEDPVGESVLRSYLCGREDRSVLDRAADLDIGGYLPEYQLCYMDRMSMAHGLEVRSPLCDHELVDFVSSLPPAYRLKGRRTKHILKQVARQWVPKRIVNRPKVGFDSPFGQWAKTELRDFTLSFLSREHVERTGLLNHEGVARLVGDHMSGRRNYSLQLWSLIALEAWHRMYLEDGLTDGTAYRLEDIRGVPRGGHSAPGGTTDDRRPGSIGRAAGPTRRKGVLAGMTRRHLWTATPPAIRKALLPVIRAVPQKVLLGGRFRKRLRFLDAARHWDRGRFEQYQLDQLRRLCRLAAGAPFYKERFAQAGVDPARLGSVGDIARLPTMDKDTLRERLADMCVMPPDSSRAEIVSTGGTGGVPVEFAINKDRSTIEYAHLVASWRRAGFALGIPMAVLRGRAVRPDRRGRRHEYDPLLHHHYYSSFHMTEESMQAYLRHIAGIGPCFLHAYPSTAAALARFLLRSGQQAPGNIRGIIAESEIVYPDQRRMIQEVFRCRLFSCYGHSEKLVLAAGCEHSDDYHVWPTYGYFELLDEEGDPVTAPGQRGEIVGTGFINTVMPFIRYRTGDFATYVGDRCEGCGREHTLLRDIRGHRTQEVLITADRTEIPWTAMNMHDETFANVRQFQFYQDRPGRAVLRIVPAPAFGEEDARRILANLDTKLDGQIRIEIERVESIRSTERGKAIYVDQKIPRAQPTVA